MSNGSLIKQYFHVFSRTARTCDQKNNVVKQDRLEILLEKPKIPTKIHKTMNRSPAARSMKNTGKLIKQSKSAQSTYAFAAQGRRAYYKSNGRKDNGPAYGYYNCNYELVTPRTPSAGFMMKPTTQSKVSRPSTDVQFRTTNRPSGKLKLPLSFAKQLPRDFKVLPLNEKRFENINRDPLVLSSIRRVPSPEFGRTQGHDFYVKQCENSVSYLGKLSQLNVRCLAFQKCLDRKGLVLDSINDLNYDNISYSLTEKAAPSFSFRKTFCTEVLPSHMTTNFTRAALNTVTDCTLRESKSQLLLSVKSSAGHPDPTLTLKIPTKGDGSSN